MSERPGVMLYFSILESLDRMDKNEAGQLLLEAMHYAKSGVEPELSGSAYTYWPTLRFQIDHDAEQYEKKRAQRQYAVSCREAKKNKHENPNSDDRAQQFDDRAQQFDDRKTSFDDRKTSFDESRYPISISDSIPIPVPIPESVSKSEPVSNTPREPSHPDSVEEAQAYADSAGLGIDAHKFYDYYQAVGWTRGNEPIVDWKALLNVWASREKNVSAKDNRYSIGNKENIICSL